MKLPNMKLPKLIDTKNPRFRLGGSAALATVLVIAAAVLANLVAARIPVKADLSAFQLYTLSDQTKKILESLDEDVVMYACFKEGSAPSEIAEALARYDEASAKVSLRYIDIERDPGFAKRYASEEGNVSSGSVVIVGTKSDRYRTIPYYDLYELGYDQQTGRQTVRGVQLERQVTGAFSYVASGKTYKIYETAGHGEAGMADFGLSAELEKQNYGIVSLNLLTKSAVPDDASLLVLMSPQSDFGEAEANALRAYLERGGDTLVFLDPGPELPRLEEVLSLYGVRRLSGLVMEGTESKRLAGNPFFLLPELQAHEIADPLIKSRLAVTYPASSALVESPLRRREAQLKPLLQTSPSSWLRADLEDSDTVRKGGDALGPFVLAYAVEVSRDEGKADPARLVVAGSSFFLDPRNPAPAPGNRDLFLNMTSWTIGRTEGPSISPKYFFSLPVQTDGLTLLILLAVFIVVIPGGILAAGAVVWLRRRNR